jgi:hypothetical protein
MLGRGAVRAGTFVSCALALAAIGACADLFHSTDFETRCDLDARAPDCPGSDATPPKDSAPDVVDAGPTNFCNWTSSEARSHAEHACAWLGACSAPFDQNAFGPCMINAILAYDCETNPNLTIAPGPLHAYWDKLWQVKSCAEVTALLNPGGVSCTGSGFACPSTEPGVLLGCPGSTQAESCLVTGRVCANFVCAPSGATTLCDPPSCSGTVLHACTEGGTDMGYDCEPFGSGSCTSAEGVTAGCVPNGGAGSCTASTTVTCDDAGTASGCPTGLTAATVACPGLAGAGATCNPNAPSWDVASACQGKGGCTPRCTDSDTLAGCGQDAEFTTSCKGQGLGSCRSVALSGSATGYACGGPR